MERRCAALQEKVDVHVAEMANSEHADALLCHVEHLEKDRTSLQTVLEMKTRELTQLRTKLNEQVFQVTNDSFNSSSRKKDCLTGSCFNILVRR